MPPVILLFAKAPLPGRVKTRLQPVLSPTESAELHASFVGDALERLLGFNSIADLELHLDQETIAWTDFNVVRKLQAEGDLGSRMCHAARQALSEGREQALILGSDSPTLPLEYIKTLLDSPADIAFGPTDDGGYYAVKFRRLPAGLFENIEWSTERALEQSISSAKRLGMSVGHGPAWYDIDSPADLVRLVTEDTPPRTTAWLKNHHFLVDPPPSDI